MSKSTPPRGVISGMSNEDYHASAGISNTMLSDLARSPAHFYALHMAPDRPERNATPSMMSGTLAHCAILEPAALRDRYAIRPDGLDGRTTAGKEWATANAGREIISAAQYATAQAQCTAVLAVDELGSILSAGEPELSAFWSDDDTGLPCRCRPDWTHYHGDGSVTLLDVKTTTDASPDEFSRMVAKYGYHRQAWHYSRGFERASGKRVRRFVFATVTNSYPFLAAAYVLDEETEAQACEEVTDLLSLYASCKKLGAWPAFGGGCNVIGLPSWARRPTEIEVAYA